jgi:hypothetical protein
MPLLIVWMLLGFIGFYLFINKTMIIDWNDETDILLGSLVYCVTSFGGPVWFILIIIKKFKTREKVE